MKMKKIGLGGTCPKFVFVDPPLLNAVSSTSTIQRVFFFSFKAGAHIEQMTIAAIER